MEDALFSSVWQTLAAFSITQELQMGMVANLHTWGQNLSLYPHIHCVVPGGGVRMTEPGSTFVQMGYTMSKMFQGKYVAALGAGGIVDQALFV